MNNKAVELAGAITVVLDTLKQTVAQPNRDQYYDFGLKYLQFAKEYQRNLINQENCNVGDVVVRNIAGHSRLASNFAAQNNWRGALEHSYLALSALPGISSYIPDILLPPPGLKPETDSESGS